MTRRFYLVEIDHYNRGAYKFEFPNQDALLPHLPDRRGTHRFQTTQAAVIGHVGILPWPGVPKVVIGRGSTKPLDFYTSFTLLVSDRIKQLFEAMDPGAFEFLAVEASQGKPGDIGPYWMFDVIRVLDCIDEARSEIVYYEMPRDPITGAYEIDPSTRAYRHFLQVTMRPELADDHLALRPLPGPQFMIFDGRLVDAIRAIGATGFGFCPLQMPTGKELSKAYRLQNWSHWEKHGAVAKR